MVKLTREQTKDLVEKMEFFLDNEGTMTVSELMKKLDIEDFDDYRRLSELSMPAIRRKNDVVSYRTSAAQYKGLYHKERQDRVVTDEVLKAAMEYLERRFRNRKPVIIKPEEQEDVEDGEDNDPVGNDCESDQ